ncbi:MAG: DinB family protein, partial [bacterium]
AFEALKRAVNQLSLEQLDWISPGRPRSMRQLLWHSFERPLLGIEAHEGGEYTEQMVRRYEELAQNYPTHKDICAFADRTEAGLAEFLGRGDRLAKKVQSYMGPITVHELIELALGHAIQHLRQAYHYMPMMGIEPDRPLDPKEYEEVPVPKDLF